MALRIAGVHPSCECTLSANCYCSTRSHVCFFSEKGRFIQTIQVSSRILFDNLCLSETSFIINTYIILKKKKYKEKSRKCANFSRIEKIENKTCDKLEWSYEIREKEQNQTARVPAFVYISGTSSGSSSSGAKAPLTSRTIFKPGIESNAPHACTHARTQPRVPRKRARERSETDAMRCTVPYSRHCPYNVPLSQFLSPFFALRRRFTRQPTFVGTNGRLHPFEIKI